MPWYYNQNNERIEIQPAPESVPILVPESAPVSEFTPQQVFCANCGNAVTEQTDVCMSCGCAPTGRKKFWRDCGVSLNSEQVVCINCGVAINIDGFGNIGDKSKNLKSAFQTTDTHQTEGTPLNIPQKQRIHFWTICYIRLVP